MYAILVMTSCLEDPLSTLLGSYIKIRKLDDLRALNQRCKFFILTRVLTVSLLCNGIQWGIRRIQTIFFTRTAHIPQASYSWCEMLGKSRVYFCKWRSMFIASTFVQLYSHSRSRLLGYRLSLRETETSMPTLLRVILAISIFWLYKDLTGYIQRSSHNDAIGAVMLLLLTLVLCADRSPSSWRCLC